MKKLLFLALFLVTPVAHADILGNKDFGIVINNQALNGSPNTGLIALRGEWSGLRLDIQATRAAYTDVGFVCVQSNDAAGTTTYNLTETLAGGATSQLHPIYTSSASVNYTVTLNVAGFAYVKCTFTGTSAGATDYVTVRAYGTRGL